MNIPRVLIVCVSLTVLTHAQAQFPMQYVDEVGHMGGDWWWDQRDSANLGLATVYVEDKDKFRFEGQDNAGNLWRLWIPRVGGTGATEVWKADLDQNGHTDLLISQFPSQNGRCHDLFDLFLLLFNDNGRPAAWEIQTHGFSGLETPLGIIVDANQNGRAEVIVNDCSYSVLVMGVDRQITGVYEAQDARWVPLRGAKEAVYQELVETALKKIGIPTALPDYLKWLPMEPSKWPDSLESVGLTGLPRLELAD